MSQLNMNQMHYKDELRTMLGSPVTRIFLWRLIVEDCHVFDVDFAFNASAYALLAKQSIGKRLLEDMKEISPELTLQAEMEYRTLTSYDKPQSSQEGEYYGGTD